MKYAEHQWNVGIIIPGKPEEILLSMFVYNQHFAMQPPKELAAVLAAAGFPNRWLKIVIQQTHIRTILAKCFSVTNINTHIHTHTHESNGCCGL